MNTQVTIIRRTTETLPAVIAGHVSVPGEVGYDRARQAWNLASDQRPSVVVSAESPTDVVHAVQVAHAHGMRIVMPGTLRYHSISCACEQCIRVDERIPSVSPPVTITFDAEPLCGYYEFHKFMYVELCCGFSKGHTSKHYDYRHRGVLNELRQHEGRLPGCGATLPKAKGTGRGSEPFEPLQAAMLLRTARMRSVHIDQPHAP